MNFITWIWKTPVTWKVWQFGVMKWSLIALGIVLGTAFADFWMPYLWAVGLVCVVLTLWSSVMYFRAMRKV